VSRPLHLVTFPAPGALLAAPAVADSLTLADARVRALPPTQSMTAGCLSATNSGDAAVRRDAPRAGHHHEH